MMLISESKLNPTMTRHDGNVIDQVHFNPIISWEIVILGKMTVNS